MTELIQIKQLSVAFQHEKQKVTVVNDLSFGLTPGQTLALVGESGSGKSLTSLAIMRLLPTNAVYGAQSSINYLEKDLLNVPERLMRNFRGRELAMIFQEPMTALDPVLTIGEQLAEALQEHRSHMQKKDLLSEMLNLLKDVELSHPERVLRQYPYQLSGGQKQRVVIAMALAGHPEVLIADEPTTALDVTIQAQILALLKKLQLQYQMSILLITHDLGVVKAMADSVCLIYAGQVVEYATAETFFKQPMHPYAQQLFFSLPSYAKRAEQLQTIPGRVPAFDQLPSGCRFHPRCAHTLSRCKTESPLLQTLPKDRTVRCHLYPEHSSPPELPMNRLDWFGTVGAREDLLTVTNLAVHFHNRRGLWRHQDDLCKAVDDLSFTLYKGKTLALVGESGCGKTTVSRALMRLQTITSGEMWFEGENIATLRGRSLRHYRKKVQIIFQDPYSSMNPRMTVDQILAEGMIAQGMRLEKIRSRQYALLDQVHLSRESLHRYPHQFSGGQRQRICIARALATEPKLLICDEPTSALDMSVQAQILNLLRALQHEFGLSYLFITHNMSVVSYIADDVLVMRNGTAVEAGSCEQILMHPQHSYTRQLLASVL